MTIGIVDEPIIGQNQDWLEIKKHADALVQFIKETDTPMTIGVQGEWGSGKTSLLNQIKEELSSFSEIRQIWINSWENSLMVTPEQCLIKIINEIIDEILGSDLKHSKKDKIAKIASSVFKGALKVGAAATMGVKAGEELDKVMEGENENNIKKLRSTLNVLIQDITNASSNAYKKIVIYVDDLDRVEPRDAVKILELLKNIFNLRHCVFVLAIDYQVVVKGLKDKFGEQTEENEWEFRAFFDKIIQLPFMMPMGQYNISNYIKNLLVKIEFIKEGDFEEDHIKTVIMNTIGGNPRSLKRLINSVSLIKLFTGDTKLIETDEEKTLSENEQKLLLFSLLCLQIAFPKIYELLNFKPDFTNWDNDLAFQQTRKKEEESKAFDVEFSNATKTDDFDEEWEQCLFRVCYINPRLKPRVIEISKFLTFIKDEFLKDNEDEIGQIIAQVLSKTSVTSVTSTDQGQEYVLPERKGAYTRRYLEDIETFVYDKKQNEGYSIEMLEMTETIYNDIKLVLQKKDFEIKFAGGITFYTNKRKFLGLWFSKKIIYIEILKNFKNNYRLPELEDLDVTHIRKFNKEVKSSAHASEFFNIRLSQLKPYMKHKKIINDLYLESFEMLDKYKDKLLNLSIREGRPSWFKGQEITDNDETKKIGVRYLSPKHSYNPYKKAQKNEGEE